MREYKEYRIIRKSDKCVILSLDLVFNDVGVWVNDELETNRKDCRLFIPYSNIEQIAEYTIISDDGVSK